SHRLPPDVYRIDDSALHPCLVRRRRELRISKNHPPITHPLSATWRNHPGCFLQVEKATGMVSPRYLVWTTSWPWPSRYSTSRASFSALRSARNLASCSAVR